MNATLLKNLIEQRHWVAVKENNGNWIVFMYINVDNNFEGTVSHRTIEQALESGLDYEYYTEETIKQYFTNEYKVVTPAPKMLKIGDKVEILENVKECVEYDNWTDEKKEMVGQKSFEINSVRNNYYWIYTKDKSVSYSFPHWAVALCEDEPTETITIGGIKYNKAEVEERLKDIKSVE